MPRIEKQEQNAPNESVVHKGLAQRDGITFRGGGTGKCASVEPDGIAGELAPRNGRGIRVFAEGLRIAISQDLYHPVIEVIDRVAKDRLKTPVIFFVSLFNIISQT